MTGLNSYAQNFEDVMLWRALGRIKNGFYIDIGAQDALVDSISLAFHEKGWRGIHVEPISYYAELLRVGRPGDTVIQAAVGNGSSLLTFFAIPNTGLSTADPTIAQQHRDNGFDVQEITVPCITLSEIFALCAESEIHWLKIDVEGFEKQVLSSWVESSKRPWIVVVESTAPGSQIESQCSWSAILETFNYSEVYFDGLNRYYVSEAHSELKKAFNTPPNVFDAFTLNGTASNRIHHLIFARHQQQINELIAQNEEQLSIAIEKIKELSQQLSSKQQELHAVEINWLQKEKVFNEEKSTLESQMLALQHSQQLKLQRHHTEHNLLTEAYSTQEAKLKAAIQSSIELRQALNETQQKLLTTYESFSWRITTPLRALINFISQAASLKNIMPTTCQKEHLSRKLPVSKELSMSSSFLNQPTTAFTLNELMALQDQHFIHGAYHTLFGRSPDPDGLNEYLKQLRAGIAKIEILAQLSNSLEYRTQGIHLPHLKSAVKRYKKTKWPLVGWLFDDFKKNIEQALNLIKNQPHALNDASNRHFTLLEGFIHHPRVCADQYYNAIERAYRAGNSHLHSLAQRLAEVEPKMDDPIALKILASALARSIPPKLSQRQLLIDISEISAHKSTTGRQKAMQNILHKLLIDPPIGLRVEPVYEIPGQGYRYARNFTLNFLGYSDSFLNDEVVEFNIGDLFLGLDLQPDRIQNQALFYKELRNHGIQVHFFVRDLLNNIGYFYLGEELWEQTQLQSNKLFKWRVEGPFDSSYSLALLNRETARALDKLGHFVVLHSTEGPGDFPANTEFLATNPDIAAMHTRVADFPHNSVDVVSRNLYPPRVADMQSPINMLHHYAWEESGFPQNWVADFNSNLKGMTCLSNHVKKILIDNGVSIPMLTSGCGVDHWERITPKEDYIVNAKAFRFLHVSSCFPRKGADLLLDAYGLAFTSNDEVTLIIKTFENPHNEIQQWLSERKAQNPQFPNVLVITADISDSELKALYQQCHVLVAPSKAEGFGLPMAEAMLSGLPVITTAWGGQLDFCDDENSWLIDYEFERAQTHFGLFTSAWAKANVDELAKALIQAHSLPLPILREKAEIGRRKLLEHFKWVDVVSRATNAVELWQSTPDVEHEVNIGWITTWNTKCGIAAYCDNIISNMGLNVTILAPRQDGLLEPDRDNCERCWDIGKKRTNNLQEAAQVILTKKLNILIIQFNYGFFNHKELQDFIELQLNYGLVVIFVPHSTQDPYEEENFRLHELQPALSRCHKILVHAVSDLNRLKSIGLTANVALFPLGYVGFSEIIATDISVKSSPLIVSYGYCLPPKGLIELVEAVGIIKSRGLSLRLRLVNAEYPIPVSTNLINDLKNLIKKLELDDSVELCTDYLTDKESLSLLRDASLIVFPYQYTGESASAAVRYGLAVNRPIAVTPLRIFDDLGDAVYRFAGTSPNDIAEGIVDSLHQINSNSEKAKHIKNKASNWLEQHNYEAVGKRIANICYALLQNQEHRKDATTKITQTVQ